MTMVTKNALAIGGGAATRLNSSRSAATVSTRNASHQPTDSAAGRFASHRKVPNPQHSAAIEGIPASNTDRSCRMLASDAAASPKLAIKNAAPASVVAFASSARTPVAAQTGIKYANGRLNATARSTLIRVPKKPQIISAPWNSTNCGAVPVKPTPSRANPVHRPTARATTPHPSKRKRNTRNANGQRTIAVCGVGFCEPPIAASARDRDDICCACPQLISSEARALFVHEGEISPLIVLGLHADRLRLRLSLDRIVDAHAPFLMNTFLGHRIGKAWPIGERFCQRLRSRVETTWCKSPS